MWLALTASWIRHIPWSRAMVRKEWMARFSSSLRCFFFFFSAQGSGRRAPRGCLNNSSRHRKMLYAFLKARLSQSRLDAAFRDARDGVKCPLCRSAPSLGGLDSEWNTVPLTRPTGSLKAYLELSHTRPLSITVQLRGATNKHFFLKCYCHSGPVLWTCVTKA